jgi:hypothetical protein
MVDQIGRPVYELRPVAIVTLSYNGCYRQTEYHRN